ncbi:MAG: hypothetical protein RMJ43_07500 [Chloroherpetonaceae bacterium]|nr:hypothetical protein [Chthonomonadaceae bacterium]MDW8207667.1 hypothetical protein [Chloroherpetonaceae bacterium]
MPVPSEQHDELDQLVVAVQSSAKYRTICPQAIRRIGQRTLTQRRNRKEAIKEIKNTLHQIAGAYLTGTTRYDLWLHMLRSEDPVADVCRHILTHHASTRERLPFLETFYAETLAGIAPVHSILDVACGLNPLAIPFMPLAPGACYVACDLFTDLADFLNAFFTLTPIRGQALACDILTDLPEPPVQLALVLKLLPILEQWDRQASLQLLRRLNASHILVSYPTRTLGGRGKGMGATYEARFLEIVRTTGWPYRRFEFPNELCFLISKSSGGNPDRLEPGLMG